MNRNYTFPVERSQNLTVLSSAQLTIFSPFPRNAMCLNPEVWPEMINGSTEIYFVLHIS